MGLFLKLILCKKLSIFNIIKNKESVNFVQDQTCNFVEEWTLALSISHYWPPSSTFLAVASDTGILPLSAQPFLIHLHNVHEAPILSMFKFLCYFRIYFLTNYRVPMHPNRPDLVKIQTLYRPNFSKKKNRPFTDTKIYEIQTFLTKFIFSLKVHYFGSNLWSVFNVLDKGARS